VLGLVYGSNTVADIEVVLLISVHMIILRIRLILILKPLIIIRTYLQESIYLTIVGRMPNTENTSLIIFNVAVAVLMLVTVAAYKTSQTSGNKYLDMFLTTSLRSSLDLGRLNRGTRNSHTAFNHNFNFAYIN
jgi:hypothetical protein